MTNNKQIEIWNIVLGSIFFVRHCTLGLRFFLDIDAN